MSDKQTKNNTEENSNVIIEEREPFISTSSLVPEELDLAKYRDYTHKEAYRELVYFSSPV